MTRVVNIRRSRYDVYCGRPGAWGNRHRIGKDGNRNEVIVKHRRDLSRDIADGTVSLEDLAALSGKRLGCYCAPRPCHADNLAQAADAAKAVLDALARFQENGATIQAASHARELAKQAVAAETRSITLEPDGTLTFRMQEGSGTAARTAIRPDGTLVPSAGAAR